MPFYANCYVEINKNSNQIKSAITTNKLISVNLKKKQFKEPV